MDFTYVYEGNDLGAIYSKEKTSFRVWAPMASEVVLKLYEEGNGDNLIDTVPMTSAEGGTWFCEKSGDMHGIYYTYLVTNNGKTEEVVDIYAKGVGVNGTRGMILDMKRTNPDGFEEDVRPAFSKEAKGGETDAIIYEVHYRDLTADKSSGIQHVGKFLGLAERGTVNGDGLTTGLDHILELGVTHVQIQPSYDYATVDEAREDVGQYNWGYDPKNYNVPEGSYSTDPFHGEVRIREMKKMIQTLHKCGLRVNMDVVYNHTYNIADSWFHKIVPDYYHRKAEDGTYSDGSACGNETASDHAMMRKYMVDSVVYWAKEYHIDGFRFDLMGIHDMETMRAIRAALNEIDPSIMVYGEGWSGGTVALPYEKLAMKKYTYLMEGVGAFSDDIRDGIKGNVFLDKDKGFANGKDGMEEIIKFSVVGATKHPQVTCEAWAGEPGQSINYVSCHDNYTLWDKLAIANEEDSLEDRIRMNKLAAAIVLTAQGVPFMLAGEELLRSKPGIDGKQKYVENSFCSPDEVNSIKWSQKKDVLSVFEYYKGLIAFRKAHASLRLHKADDIRKRLRFIALDETIKNVVAYCVDEIIVVYNANKEAVSLALPEGKWDIYIDGNSAGCEKLATVENTCNIQPISATVLVKHTTE